MFSRYQRWTKLGATTILATFRDFSTNVGGSAASGARLSATGSSGNVRVRAAPTASMGSLSSRWKTLDVRAAVVLQTMGNRALSLCRETGPVVPAHADDDLSREIRSAAAAPKIQKDLSPLKDVASASPKSLP